MPSWDFIRGPFGAQLFVEVGVEHGLSPARCLRGTGLTSAELADPTTEVQARQELQAGRNLVEALGWRPGLGVEVGRRVTVGGLGIWAFATVTSATYGEAVRLSLRFAELSPTFLRFELAADAAEARLRLHDDELPPDLAELLVERDLTAIALMARTMIGRLPPLRLETRLGPASAAALARAIDDAIEPIAGCAANALIVPAELMAVPLPQADAATRRACEQEALRLLEARRARAGAAARVRALLLARPDRMPAMSAVAAELSVDVRTLRRRLAAEGTSFRALRDEVRETLAVELLGTVGLSIGEVAARLGYADPVSFTHAFTRWKGVPPGRFQLLIAVGAGAGSSGCRPRSHAA